MDVVNVLLVPVVVAIHVGAAVANALTIMSDKARHCFSPLTLRADDLEESNHFNLSKTSWIDYSTFCNGRVFPSPSASN